MKHSVCGRVCGRNCYYFEREIALHKLFRANEKKLAHRYNKRLLFLNIPSLAAATALLVIVNVVMRLLPSPMELYRAVFYSVNIFIAYSFGVCLAGSVISDIRLKGHRKHTYIEISDSSIVFSQYEKTVSEGGGKFSEYIKMWIMDLADVEDVYSDRDDLFIKGRARYFCLPADMLDYSVNDGKVEFAHWWNDSFGGQNVHTVKIHDNYTLGERILKRILICSEKYRTNEQKRKEYHDRMLAIAKSIDRKKGLQPRYKEPKRHLPREGIKERKWY